MFRFSVYTAVAIGVIFAIALSGLQANAKPRAPARVGVFTSAAR